MKKIGLSIFLLLIIVNLSFCLEENKDVTYSELPMSSTGFNNKDSLIIEGTRIWVREQPKTGKVVFTLDDGALCHILEKGEEQVIRGNKDFWYKIEYEGKVGWVFGSQSSIKQKASIDNFEPFLEYFLQSCFFGKNIDSLIYYKSSISRKFMHEEIGICRLYNPGVACVPLSYNFYNNLGGRYYGTIYPEVHKPKFYGEQSPEEGFCDESPNPDGIYYKTINALPNYPDITEDYKVMEISIPKKYKTGLKIKVNILHEHWIIKTMFFMVADDKWWLVVIDDCDCSA